MYGFPSSRPTNPGVSVSDAVVSVDIGKAGKHLSRGAEIGRQNESHALHEYEILLGDPRAIRWVEADGVPNPHNFGARHVDAGVDAYGYPIFIVQVSHNGSVHPARASGGASGMFDPTYLRGRGSESSLCKARTSLMATRNYWSR